MPWHLPEDLKHFRRTTLGKPVIMGRKTWESLGKALPGRLNVVITHQEGYEAENAKVVTSIDEALDIVKEYDDAFIMGGAEIYRQTIDRVSVAHITEINHNIDGDAFFDCFNESDWKLVQEDTFPVTDNRRWSFSIRRYER